MIDLVDLKEIRYECSDLTDLQALLKQLIGQPFQFFRVAYGDELRLHLGNLRGYSNAKMRGRAGSLCYQCSVVLGCRFGYEVHLAGERRRASSERPKVLPNLPDRSISRRSKLAATSCLGRSSLA